MYIDCEMLQEERRATRRRRQKELSRLRNECLTFNVNHESPVADFIIKFAGQIRRPRDHLTKFRSR
jgi:hypothetical protein